VDMGYCIFCGLCIEACPFEALFLGYGYERAKYRRGELIRDREELLASDERKASGYGHPEIAATLPKQSLLLDKDRGKR
jgi:NAD(P)H-quinone oxidoreductase subunit I